MIIIRDGRKRGGSKLDGDEKIYGRGELLFSEEKGRQPLEVKKGLFIPETWVGKFFLL